MSNLKTLRRIIFSLILLGAGTVSFFILNRESDMHRNVKSKPLIVGKWNVDSCQFKIPGWHTDITNSKYIFYEDQKLLIQSEDGTDKSTIKYFVNDGKRITLREAGDLSEITYEFRFISEGKLEWEDELVFISLSLIKR